MGFTRPRAPPGEWWQVRRALFLDGTLDGGVRELKLDVCASLNLEEGSLRRRGQAGGGGWGWGPRPEVIVPGQEHWVRSS